MTLIEVLIGGALISVVAGSAYLLYLAMLDTLSTGELKADLQQSARVGLSKLEQEIRMVGYDPSGAIPLVTLPPKAAIRAATPTCFSFVGLGKDEGDRDKDGDKEEEWTVQVTFSLDGTTLRRKAEHWNPPPASEFSGGGGAQPLAESVDVLMFTYYDANNQVLTIGDWTSTHACPPDPKAKVEKRKQLTYEQMRQIRRVAITLRTRGSRPGVSSESYTLTSDVRLRNL